MANKAVKYIRDAVTSIFDGEEREKRKKDALKEIYDYLESPDYTGVPQTPTLPETPRYERMQYDAPTDDEIEKRAESELVSYRESGKANIERDSEEKKKKYDADIASAESKRDSAVKSSADAYEQAKKNTDDDMLRRGIARSSIAANKRAKLESEQAAARSAIESDYANRITEIGEKITELTAERAKALDEFDIAYASKLGTRINELVVEREKKRNEVLKYNNSLAEKEHAAEVERKMKESDLYGESLDNAKKQNELSGGEDGKFRRAYAVIANALRGINSHDAREIVLNDPEIKSAVGSTYFYYRLYDEFVR